MSPAATLRYRRARLARAETARTRAGLSDAASGLRSLAQEQIDAGRPDLARPYLDEVALFEGAVRRLPTS